MIIAEISANHCGSKKKFLNHIVEAKKNGADLVKIQTYEPQDMVVNKNIKLKKVCGRTLIYGNYMKRLKLHLNGTKMHLRLQKKT